MIDTKKDANGNEIHLLQLKKKELNKKYPEIDRGEEGIVYNYQNLYAFKIFYSNWFKSRKEKIQILIKIDEAIERIHKKGIIIGDVNPKNIMIGEEDIKFIDTDSYIYGDYPIDYNYRTISDFYREFGIDKSLIDCDKYYLADLAVAYIFSDEYLISYPQKNI